MNTASSRTYSSHVLILLLRADSLTGNPLSLSLLSSSTLCLPPPYPLSLACSSAACWRPSEVALATSAPNMVWYAVACKRRATFYIHTHIYIYVIYTNT
jgi:hypothetical protein